MRNKHSWMVLVLCFCCFLLVMKCSVMEESAGVFQKVSQIVSSDKESVSKTTKALRSGFGDITEEEEYYIGRAVAAIILSRYPVYQDDGLHHYVNSVGKAVVFHSERPETYMGYHFCVLDTDEVNALSAPSGFIFISKGLLKRCEDEEMLGSVLAHEVGHVQKKHGLQAIKNARLVEVFTLLGKKAVEKHTPQDLSQLTDIFEGALSDIVEKLIERGYDRKYEYEADRLSVQIASRTGYNPHGLVAFLKTMEPDPPSAANKGWFKTHPSAENRISRAQKEIAALDHIPPKIKARTTRFKKALSRLQ
ncbi:MAG: M48 family metalloprotease [Candidatus Aminicenantes bacterium]|nr:M48 family metalloprotease [Candidatus Aminicenantes bacterium]